VTDRTYTHRYEHAATTLRLSAPFSVQAFFIEQLAFAFEVEGLDEPSEVCFDIASPVSKVVEGARVARLTITQLAFKRIVKCTRAARGYGLRS